MEIKDYSGNVIFATERDTLVGASLSGLNLENANFRGMDVSHANFCGANLLGASFHGAIARNTSFSGARLTYVSFTNADVYGAFFNGAELVGAALNGANLIIAGQDWRGYLFYATGNDEGIKICAGCRRFSSMSDARDHWESRHENERFLREQCLAYLDTLERLSKAKGWAQSTPQDKRVADVFYIG